jgi:catechol 2,3-dioxygenase-like lactoylglutathione lyase family enzyme
VNAVAEIALFTDDVEAAMEFYAGVLGATPVAEWPGGAIFAAGDSKLLVHERSAALESGPPNEDHFAFSVVDLDAACDELRARGASLLVEPREYPWGRSAYIRDPDGRLVELAEQSG